MIKTKKSHRTRVCQGDVYQDIEHIEYIVEKSGQLEISKIVFPLVVVLTQDCDLAQDYKFRWSKKNTSTQDKWLISVLVAPMYNAEHVFSGEHLSLLGMTMEPINSKKTPGKLLCSNERPRYHHLVFPDSIPIVDSVVDFKHYFSANIQYLRHIRKKKFVCRLAELYREDVSQRFAAYLSRIGLPDQVA